MAVAELAGGKAAMELDETATIELDETGAEVLGAVAAELVGVATAAGFAKIFCTSASAIQMMPSFITGAWLSSKDCFPQEANAMPSAKRMVSFAVVSITDFWTGYQWKTALWAFATSSMFTRLAAKENDPQTNKIKATISDALLQRGPVPVWRPVELCPVVCLVGLFLGKCQFQVLRVCS